MTSSTTPPARCNDDVDVSGSYKHPVCPFGRPGAFFVLPVQCRDFRKERTVFEPVAFGRCAFCIRTACYPRWLLIPTRPPLRQRTGTARVDNRQEGAAIQLFLRWVFLVFQELNPRGLQTGVDTDAAHILSGETGRLEPRGIAVILGRNNLRLSEQRGFRVRVSRSGTVPGYAMFSSNDCAKQLVPIVSLKRVLQRKRNGGAF